MRIDEIVNKYIDEAFSDSQVDQKMKERDDLLAKIKKLKDSLYHEGSENRAKIKASIADLVAKRKKISKSIAAHAKRWNEKNFYGSSSKK